MDKITAILWAIMLQILLMFSSSPQRPDRLLGPPSLLTSWYQGLFPRGVNRPGREADCSPPSSAEIKNEYLSLPFPVEKKRVRHGEN